MRHTFGRASRAAMEYGIVRFQGRVAGEGYKISGRQSVSRVREVDLFIEPLAPHAECRTYGLNLGERDVFRELALTPPTEDGAIKFTNRWGMLYGGLEFRLSWFFRCQSKLIEAMKEAELADSVGLSAYFSDKEIATLEVQFEEPRK